MELLNLYWNIGKYIMKIQQRDERTSYGDYLLDKFVAIKIVTLFRTYKVEFNKIFGFEKCKGILKENR